MDATKRPRTEVERAVLAHRRAIDRLIRCLRHKDRLVRMEASAALRSLGGEAEKAPTVEGSVKGMRELLDSRVKWWA